MVCMLQLEKNATPVHFGSHLYLDVSLIEKANLVIVNMC